MDGSGASSSLISQNVQRGCPESTSMSTSISLLALEHCKSIYRISTVHYEYSKPTLTVLLHHERDLLLLTRQRSLYSSTLLPLLPQIQASPPRVSSSIHARPRSIPVLYRIILSCNGISRIPDRGKPMLSEHSKASQIRSCIMHHATPKPPPSGWKGWTFERARGIWHRAAQGGQTPRRVHTG